MFVCYAGYLYNHTVHIHTILVGITGEKHIILITLTCYIGLGFDVHVLAQLISAVPRIFLIYCLKCVIG